jgi:RND family efflux transporter MFP subunit
MDGRSLVYVVLGALLASSARAADDKEVKVSQLVRREITKTTWCQGVTEAVESVNVRARVAGCLEKIHFRAGAEVKKGDLLFEIDAELPRAEVEKAQAEVDRAEAVWKLAAGEHKRAEKSGTATEAALAELAAREAQAAASLKRTRANLAVHKLHLDRTRIHASISGKIGRPLVSVGEMVKADETLLATIVGEERMHAVFKVTYDEVVKLRKALKDSKAKGKDLPVYLGIRPDDGCTRRGRIDYVEFPVREKNSSGDEVALGRVYVIVSNPGKDILPGLDARCELPLSCSFQALPVSSRAVFNVSKDKTHVLVVNEKNAIESREVKLRDDPGSDYYTIEKGVKPGEWIVVEDVGRIAREIGAIPNDPAPSPMWAMPIAAPTSPTLPKPVEEKPRLRPGDVVKPRRIVMPGYLDDDKRKDEKDKR